MNRFAFVLLTLLSIGVVGSSSATPPQMITYQGILTDNAGTPLSGTHNLVFKIYRDSTAMIPILWSETHSGVPVTNGLFNVILGRSTPIPVNVFVAEERWLGVTVDSDAEMAPRMRFTSAPWAFRAAIADSAIAGPGGGGGGWTISGNDIYASVSGNVGIGTTTPGKKLQVGNASVANSEGMIRLGSHSGTNGSNRTWDIGVPETDAVSSGYGYSFILDDIALGTDPEFMVKWGSGRVGIGTSAPARKLQIDGGNVEDGIRLAYGSDYPDVYGEIRRALSSGLIINSNAAGSMADINFQTDGVTRAYITSTGLVGIGTTTPARRLHIDCGNTESGIRIAYGSDYSSLYGEIRRTMGTGLIINSNADGGWADINFQTDGVTRAYITSTGNFGIGTSTPTTLLDVAGTAKVQILQITGADVAEKFPINERVEPGMVVAIDPEHPGELCVARGEYNRRVAGVVSGAGDLPVGAVLGNLPGHEDALPVALTGRVWVQCDTSGGPIAPGDMLTTSSHPGVAMKAADASRAAGAIIGKAMTALHDGSGQVLTLVSLQ